MNKVIDTDCDGRIVRTSNDCLWRAFTKSMVRNNSFCPAIDNVIFSLKTSETKAVRDADGKLVIDETSGKPKRETVALEAPILATTVMFTDGTKVSVVNSGHDAVTLDPKNPKVASAASKEAGIVYAIVKRIFGKPLENGMIDGDGFGRKLRDIAKMAYDPVLAEAANAKAKEKRIADHKARIAKAKKAAEKHPSLAYTVKNLAETVEKLNNTLATKA